MLLKKEEKWPNATNFPEQLQELRHLRDTGEPAYLRERAAALLKIAAGLSPH